MTTINSFNGVAFTDMSGADIITATKAIKRKLESGFKTRTETVEAWRTAHALACVVNPTKQNGCNDMLRFIGFDPKELKANDDAKYRFFKRLHVEACKGITAKTPTKAKPTAVQKMHGAIASGDVTQKSIDSARRMLDKATDLTAVQLVLAVLLEERDTAKA